LIRPAHSRAALARPRQGAARPIQPLIISGFPASVKPRGSPAIRAQDGPCTGSSCPGNLALSNSLVNPYLPLISSLQTRQQHAVLIPRRREIESWGRMELVLNLAWALSAVVFFCIWLRHARHAGADRRTQLVALAVLILILFPVISVTDDLQAMQNPAEAIAACAVTTLSRTRTPSFPLSRRFRRPSRSFPWFSALAAPGSLPARLQVAPPSLRFRTGPLRSPDPSLALLTFLASLPPVSAMRTTAKGCV